MTCWLCDRQHLFHQCTDQQVRVKTICAKHPQVLTHFQQMLLNKPGGGDVIKVQLELPGIFDDSILAKDDILHEKEGDHNHVNSLQVLPSDFFTSQLSASCCVINQTFHLLMNIMNTVKISLY
jgi:hypothetical protein